MTCLEYRPGLQAASPHAIIPFSFSLAFDRRLCSSVFNADTMQTKFTYGQWKGRASRRETT